MAAGKLDKLVEDFFTVVQALDTIKILSVDLIPKTFFEPVPTRIPSAFFDYLDSDEAKKAETESINQRYEAKYYDSLYKIYHDLKVISMILVSKFKAGDTTYMKIDSFYNFAVLLLISEGARIQESFLENTDESVISLTNLESEIAKDYELITTAYTEPQAEALFLIGNKNTALFSSLLKKSSLDERDLGIEHPFIRSIIAPQIEQQQVSANTLGNLSPGNPSQVVITEQITTDLFHPNWFGLPVSNWLKPSLESASFSFLPQVDSSKAVVSNELKGLTWLQQVGFKELVSLRNPIEEEDVSAEDDESERETVEESKKETVNGADTPAPSVLGGSETNGKQDTVSRESKLLDLKNLLTFNPAVDEEKVISSILDDKSSSTKYIQSRISTLLLQLNKISKIPARNLTLEKQIYFKIERLIKYVILKNNISPNELQLPLSYKIPVTQNNYAGSLPGSLLGSMTSTTTTFNTNGVTIRPGITGYKTNRLSSINKKYRR